MGGWSTQRWRKAFYVVSELVGKFLNYQFFRNSFSSSPSLPVLCFPLFLIFLQLLPALCFSFPTAPHTHYSNLCSQPSPIFFQPHYFRLKSPHSGTIITLFLLLQVFACKGELRCIPFPTLPFPYPALSCPSLPCPSLPCPALLFFPHPFFFQSLTASE